MYMVPPFIAYYGVLTQNRTLLGEAYTQIQLYRNYLRDANAGGLWKHVLLGASGMDEGHWSTGKHVLPSIGTLWSHHYAALGIRQRVGSRGNVTGPRHDQKFRIRRQHENRAKRPRRLGERDPHGDVQQSGEGFTPTVSSPYLTMHLLSITG